MASHLRCFMCRQISAWRMGGTSRRETFSTTKHVTNYSTPLVHWTSLCKSRIPVNICRSTYFFFSARPTFFSINTKTFYPQWISRRFVSPPLTPSTLVRECTTFDSMVCKVLGKLLRKRLPSLHRRNRTYVII